MGSERAHSSGEVECYLLDRLFACVLELMFHCERDFHHGASVPGKLTAPRSLVTVQDCLFQRYCAAHLLKEFRIWVIGLRHLSVKLLPAYFHALAAPLQPVRSRFPQQ